MKTKLYKIVDTDVGNVECPMHINRIDYTHPSGSTTRGWQVRFCRVDEPYHSKMFSDGVYGGVMMALYEAENYLEQLQPHYRQHDQCNVGQSQHIVLAWNTHTNRPNILQLTAHVHICSYMKKRRVKGFFVATKKTLTDERIEIITRHCQDLVQWRNEIITTHGREYLMSCDIPAELNHFSWMEQD